MDLHALAVYLQYVACFASLRDAEEKQGAPSLPWLCSTNKSSLSLVTSDLSRCWSGLLAVGVVSSRGQSAPLMAVREGRRNS